MSASEPERIRRLLVVRNDRLGDLVMTLPVFEAARKALPEAHVAALVAPYAAPLLERNPYLDEVMLDDASESGWALGRRLRRGRFDAAIVVNTNTRNSVAMWHARIPARVLWSHRPAGLLLATHHVKLHRSHPPVHEAEFALAFVRRLGMRAKMADLHPCLDPDPDARARAAERIAKELGERRDSGPLFAIAPTSKGSAYNWPLERYADLASRLAAHGRVMVTGAAGDAGTLARMREGLAEEARGRVGVFTDLDLAEFIGALGEADVMTASSTGPMHIAGAVGTPVVALFSPNPVHSPAKWAPFGERNILLVPPVAEGDDLDAPPERGREYMERISVDEVVEANLGLAGAG